MNLSNAPVARALSIRLAAVSSFGALALKSLKFKSNAAILLSIASNWAEIFLNCSSMVKTGFWILIQFKGPRSFRLIPSRTLIPGRFKCKWAHEDP